MFSQVCVQVLRVSQRTRLASGPQCDSSYCSDPFHTGKVVKDEVVNTESAMSGNEYLANLDYIEGVEKLKEGYESEAHCSDKEDESDKKTLVTMTTGALKKFLINLSSSSNEGMSV